MKFHVKLAAAAVAALLCGWHAAFAAGPGTGTYTYICAPNEIISTTYPTGNGYTAASDGIVTGVNPNDVQAFENAGCRTVGVGGNSYELLGRLVGANMNVTTDQPFVWFPAPNTVWRATKITCTNASTSLTTASGGVYTELSKGGSALSSNAAFSSLTGSTLAYDLTIASTPGNTFYTSAAATASVNGAPVLALTTAQGSAATADCYVYGQLGQ